MCPAPLQESVNLKPKWCVGVHDTTLWYGDYFVVQYFV